MPSLDTTDRVVKLDSFYDTLFNFTLVIPAVIGMYFLVHDVSGSHFASIVIGGSMCGIMLLFGRWVIPDFRWEIQNMSNPHWRLMVGWSVVVFCQLLSLLFMGRLMSDAFPVKFGEIAPVALALGLLAGLLRLGFHYWRTHTIDP